MGGEKEGEGKRGRERGKRSGGDEERVRKGKRWRVRESTQS